MRLSALFTIFLSLCVIGCTPTKAVRGNYITEDKIADLNVGTHTKSDVQKILGSPTTIAPFNENTWYYIGQKTEKQGFVDPKVIEKRVMMVVFNDDGVLQTAEEIQDDSTENLPIVKRKTPTSGNEVTVMQQLLGNLGRFNQSAGDDGSR